MSNVVYIQQQQQQQPQQQQSNGMPSNLNMNMNVTPTKQRQSGQVLILNRSPLGAMTNSSAQPVLPAKKFRSEPVEILRCKRRPDLAKMGYRVNQQSVLRRNERERNRVKTINSTFQTLRQHLPAPSGKSKKLSKVDTLKTAIKYIHHLQDVLELQNDMDTSGTQCLDNMNNNANNVKQARITYQDVTQGFNNSPTSGSEASCHPSSPLSDESHSPRSFNSDNSFENIPTEDGDGDDLFDFTSLF